jgi:hypothetical protein
MEEEFMAGQEHLKPQEDKNKEVGAYPTAVSVKTAIPLFPTRYAPCPWFLWRQSCPSLSSVLCGLGVEMGCTNTILMHDFEAEDQGELSLSVGDYVVVRQVCPLLIWLLL